MENHDIEKNQTPFSVLKGEEFSISKILSRDSSVGQSSRIYYCSSANEGVPFKWEMQPGTPKHPPQMEVIPPPTPPPAVQSLALPQPNFVSKDLISWRFLSWKRFCKNFRLQRDDRQGCHTRFNDHTTGKKVSNSDGDSDEFVGWVHCDSRSSSYSSLSSSSEHSERFRKGLPFLCSPWRR